MPLGNRLTTPQTDWGQTSGNEDFIREAARKDQVRQMKKFEQESMEQGLGEDPTASGYSEAYHNMEKYGFDPPPDVPTYSGFPALNIGPGFPPLPPIQPGAVDPKWGLPNEPNNLGPNIETAPNEGLERWMEDVKERGEYVQPQHPLLPAGAFPGIREPLPATKVYSAPIGAMRLPPPLPPPG